MTNDKMERECGRLDKCGMKWAEEEEEARIGMESEDERLMERGRRGETRMDHRERQKQPVVRKEDAIRTETNYGFERKSFPNGLLTP